MATPENRVKVQLRWRDMDMLGHLNQAVFTSCWRRAVLVAWDPVTRGKRVLTEAERAALS